MRWLPSPENFRNQLQLAKDCETAAGRLDRLVALSQLRLGVIENIQLDRALGQLSARRLPTDSSVKLALLSSSTIDHLLPCIRVAALRRRLLLDCYSGAYGQYRQEILDPGSSLYEFRPEVIILSLTAAEAIARISLEATNSAADSALDRYIEELREIWRTARTAVRASVIQQTFLNTAQPVFGSFDEMVPGAPVRLIGRLNERLSKAAAADGVALLDVSRASQRDGIDAWHDVTKWLHAKMEIAPQAAPLYGELAARVIAAQKGLSKRCLVLDLDDTLWGGVVGDDGVDGIVLGKGSARGEAHLALQHYAKQLRERGIVLAICSKNNAAIAEQAFFSHPEMVLRREDIAIFVANWEPKAANLEHIARSLNLGLDSLVFVDDNPAERAAIRLALPMVAVPDLPDDVSQFVRCIAEAGYFEAVSFTDDDRRRGVRYRVEATRAADQRTPGSLQHFLAGLQMVCVFGAVSEVDFSRVAQLINKTNQFNTTTRRYSQDEVARICTDPSYHCLQFRLSDRFGDSGLVSVMLLRANAQDADLMDIDTWVMSCRVFGRDLESLMMNIAVDTTEQAGRAVLRADFIATPRNGIVADLFPKFGFLPIACDPRYPGGEKWQLKLNQYKVRSTYIRREFTA